MASSRRKKGGGHAGEHADERWLLTYADMITLLMALFMVLFSISSVNTSKFESLQRSLQEAFSGRILPGGESLQQTGATQETEKTPSPEPPIPALKPITEQKAPGRGGKAAKEDEDFEKLKKEIDEYAKTHGLSQKLETEIARKGLVIRLLTDDVVFDSGSADIKPKAFGLLTKIGRLLKAEVRHPISVEGHTDAVPIRGSRYPSNWELSTARASSVVRYVIGKGVSDRRLAAVGFSALHPIATNKTNAGRSRNRRVEIVLVRQGSQEESP